MQLRVPQLLRQLMTEALAQRVLRSGTVQCEHHDAPLLVLCAITDEYLLDSNGACLCHPAIRASYSDLVESQGPAVSLA